MIIEANNALADAWDGLTERTRIVCAHHLDSAWQAFRYGDAGTMESACRDLEREILRGVEWTRQTYQAIDAARARHRSMIGSVHPMTTEIVADYLAAARDAFGEDEAECEKWLRLANRKMVNG